MSISNPSNPSNLYVQITNYKRKETEYEKKLQYLQKIIRNDKKTIEEQTRRIESLSGNVSKESQTLAKWKEAYYKVASERDRLRILVDTLRIENAQYEGKLLGLQQVLNRTLENKDTQQEKAVSSFSSDYSSHHQEIRNPSQTTKRVTWADILEFSEEPRTERIPVPTSSTQKQDYGKGNNTMDYDYNYRKKTNKEQSSEQNTLNLPNQTLTSSIGDDNEENMEDNMEDISSFVDAPSDELVNTQSSEDMDTRFESEMQKGFQDHTIFSAQLETVPTATLTKHKPSSKIILAPNHTNVVVFSEEDTSLPSKSSNAIPEISVLTRSNPNTLQNKKSKISKNSVDKLETPRLLQAPESPIPILRTKTRSKRAHGKPIYKEMPLNRKLRRGDNFTFGIEKSDIKNIYKNV